MEDVKNTKINFNTIEELENLFPDDKSAMKYFAEIRWGSQFGKCPFCGNEKSYFIENGSRYKCANKDCYKKFSVTVGCIFEATNIPLNKWFVGIFMYIKSRGRVSSLDLINQLKISQKSEFYIREKIKFVFDKLDYINKSNVDIFNIFLKGATDYYILFKEVLLSPYYNNPYCVRDIDDISDVRQYSMLERYTRYYIKVYCTWMWMDFADPRDILAETFLYMKDNGIKEYNAESIIKLIQKVSQKMWETFLNNHPKYANKLTRRNRNHQREISQNLKPSYIAKIIKMTNAGKGLTTKEIRENLELMNAKKEELLRKRKKRGANYEFISHFS